MWYSYAYKMKNDENMLNEDGGQGSSDGLTVDVAPNELLVDPYSPMERAETLAMLLKIPEAYITQSDYDPNEFDVDFGGAEGITDDDCEGSYLVLTDGEADERWRDDIIGILMDCGIDGLDIDIADYVCDDYCEETVEEYYEDTANEMSEEQLAAELLDAGEIELSDDSIFELRGREELNLEDGEEIDAGDPSSYKVVAEHWRLAGKYVDWKRDDEDFTQTFRELGFGDSLPDDFDYCIRNGGHFPSWCDIDGLIDYLMRVGYRGESLACCDAMEREIDTPYGRTYYIYRTE